MPMSSRSSGAATVKPSRASSVVMRRVSGEAVSYSTARGTWVRQSPRTTPVPERPATSTGADPASVTFCSRRRARIGLAASNHGMPASCAACGSAAAS